MKNKQFIYTFLLLLFMLSGCKKGKQEQTQKAIDTIPMLINEVQKCSKLYTVEYRLHKIIIFVMMACLFFGLNAYLFLYKKLPCGLQVKKER